MPSAVHRAARRINGDAVRELLKWVVTLFVAIPLWSLATLAPIFWFLGVVNKASKSGAIDPEDFFLFASAVALFGILLSSNRFRPKDLRSDLSKAGLWYMLSALSWVLLGTLFALDPGSNIHEHWLIQVLAVACFGIGHLGFVVGSALWLSRIGDQLFGDRSMMTQSHQKPPVLESPRGVTERPRLASLAVVAALGLVIWAWNRLSRSR